MNRCQVITKVIEIDEHRFIERKYTLPLHFKIGDHIYSKENPDGHTINDIKFENGDPTYEFSDTERWIYVYQQTAWSLTCPK